MGNIVNRVFDSSGPEGKVRGTPQQIIDKYNQLARDAQLSNDRVAAENFQQHAEHYLRMLAEAQREQAERQAQQQQQAQERRNNQQTRDEDRNEQPQPQRQPKPQQPAETTEAPAEVIEIESGESALVETPENRAPRQRRRKPAPSNETSEAPATDKQPAPPADAAE